MKKFVLLILNVIVIQNLNAENFKVSEKVPKGFENIANQKIVNFIEVKIDNLSLGFFESEYNTFEFKFLNPKEILNEINSNFIIKENKKISLLKFLSEDIINNSEYFKFRRNDLSINMKIPLEYLESNKIYSKEDLYLKNSSSDNYSFLQNIIVNYFGDIGENNELNYSLLSNSSLAYKNNRLNFNWSINNNDLSFNLLNYQNDYKGKEIQFGYVNTNTRGYSFIQNREIFGLRYGTSLNTRKDIRKEISSPITINLKNDSLVNVYREDNNQLLYSDRFSFGIHDIRINNLPSGSYNLRVEKISDNGQVEETIIPFSKTDLIPPLNENIWSIDIGYLTNRNQSYGLPDITNEIFFKLSSIKSFTTSIGVYNELSYMEDNLFYNPGIFYVFDPLTIRGSFVLGQDNINGISFDVNLAKIDENLTLRYEKINSIGNNSIFESRTDINLNYMKNLDEYGVVSLSYNYSEDNNIENKFYGLNYTKNLFNNSKYGSLNMNLEYNKNTEENFYGINFTYNFRQQNSAYRARTRITSINNNSEISYQRTKRASTYDITDQISLRDNTKGYQAQYINNYNHEKYGRSNFSINHTKNNDNSETTFFGGFTTNNVITKEGFKFGGQNNLLSGVFININGTTDVNMDIYLNDAKYSSSNGSKKVFVSMESYKEHKIKLVPSQSSSFIKAEEKSESVVLYPGNVQNISWNVFKYKIIYGRFFDKDGNILKSSKIKTSFGNYYTDNQGFSEIEVESTNPYVVIENQKCSIDVSSKEDILFIENIICR